MKRCILRICVVFIFMVLITEIQKGQAQIINHDSSDPYIINIEPHEFMVEDTGFPDSLQVCSASMRFKLESQNDLWTMSIIGTGQAGDVNIAIIGIDPNGKAYPYPPFNPPDFTIVFKIKGPATGYSEETRLPGSAQEVWNLSVMVGGAQFGGSADPNQPNFFPVLSWDPNERGPSEVLDLRLGDANGLVVADMKTDNTYQTQQSDADEYIPSLAYAMLSYAVVFEPAPLYTYYHDADGDGFGDPNDTIVYEELPPGYAENPDDCDDNDPNTYLGALEICDNRDNDCDRKIDIEIYDPNNLDLDLGDLKKGLNKIIIDTPCVSYSSYDFLLNFKELLNIASLNLDEIDVTGSFMSTYFFFGKICGNGFGLSENPSHPNILYIY